MKSKLLFLFFVFAAFAVKAQTPQVSGVTVKFKDCKDTLFAGYNNVISVKSKMNTGTYRVVFDAARISQVPNTTDFNVQVPSQLSGQTIDLIIYSTDGRTEKEVARKKVKVVTPTAAQITQYHLQ
ncbi:MAG: hypothetical protein K1X56_07425 [Flavobacteriales bacterium]|nr:hypothetical protein [Flavobacteriales bacterium]